MEKCTTRPLFLCACASICISIFFLYFDFCCRGYSSAAISSLPEFPHVSYDATPQRIPRRHEQAQHHPKHVPRHPLALRPAHHPKKERYHATELAASLVLQRHARQGLAAGHSALQVGGWRGVAGGNDSEAAALDEGESLSSILLGVWELVEEGDGGVVGGKFLSEARHRRLSVLID